MRRCVRACVRASRLGQAGFLLRVRWAASRPDGPDGARPTGPSRPRPDQAGREAGGGRRGWECKIHTPPALPWLYGCMSVKDLTGEWKQAAENVASRCCVRRGHCVFVSLDFGCQFIRHFYSCSQPLCRYNHTRSVRSRWICSIQMNMSLAKLAPSPDARVSRRARRLGVVPLSAFVNPYSSMHCIARINLTMDGWRQALLRTRGR